MSAAGEQIGFGNDGKKSKSEYKDEYRGLSATHAARASVEMTVYGGRGVTVVAARYDEL